jgi:hypothetical protein
VLALGGEGAALAAHLPAQVVVRLLATNLNWHCYCYLLLLLQPAL